LRTAEQIPALSGWSAAYSPPVSGGDPQHNPPATAARMRQELAGLHDRELLGIVRSLPPSACSC
jgi:hypothetical protein